MSKLLDIIAALIVLSIVGLLFYVGWPVMIIAILILVVFWAVDRVEGF